MQHGAVRRPTLTATFFPCIGQTVTTTATMATVCARARVLCAYTSACMVCLGHAGNDELSIKGRKVAAHSCGNLCWPETTAVWRDGVVVRIPMLDALEGLRWVVSISSLHGGPLEKKIMRSGLLGSQSFVPPPFPQPED